MKKPQQSLKKLIRGSSLIELLIAAAVIGLVLTAISAGLVYSIKSTTATKNRDFATAQANQVLEIFNRERSVLGWDEFYTKVTAASTFCFAEIPAAGGAFEAGVCTPVDDAELTSSNTVFIREADVLQQTPEHVRVEARVTWEYDGLARDVIVAKDFRRTQ